MWSFSSSPKYDISGKTVLVTGALGFIGIHVVERVVKLGATVLMADIAPADVGEDKSKRINETAGRRATAYTRTDVLQIDEIQQMFDTAKHEFGKPVDVLVNAAGVSHEHKLYDGCTSKVLDTVLRINLNATMEATRYFVEQLGSKREGAVVNFSSCAGLVPNEWLEVYGTTKSALVYFTKVSGLLAPRVRVCAVAPFFIDSPMANTSPLGIEAKPHRKHTFVHIDSMVDAIVQLIESRSSGGRVAIQLGDWTMLPDFHLELSRIYIMVMVVLACIVGMVKSLFGYKRPISA
ncbi:hypothetical protein IW140_005570 [Coemansia sp. RSA 1813]|nr:hypothetical protein EV178_005669 [Coemansia sp. RSA 1646]KAJ1767093.1 hypothetical protein LPJ74_005557 [Coemansia sp. RSA 1843]KAJ2086530.1 hypothetical protein IW138_005614 [Coemansia sp. RSA 986]KAJ2211873.1 hypothetical protein EV179_005107 [Coemansia sp. RSA 487]KAJ2564888.1 hypothetical protein IW140_005570 [Coemansia sp. RSA 1813]